MQNTEEEEVRQGTGVSWEWRLVHVEALRRGEVVDKYRRPKFPISAHKIPNNIEFGGQLSLLRKI